MWNFNNSNVPFLKKYFSLLVYIKNMPATCCTNLDYTRHSFRPGLTYTCVPDIFLPGCFGSNDLHTRKWTVFKHQTIPCLAFKEFLNMILLLPQQELLPSDTKVWNLSYKIIINDMFLSHSTPFIQNLCLIYLTISLETLAY